MNNCKREFSSNDTNWNWYDDCCISKWRYDNNINLRLTKSFIHHINTRYLEQFFWFTDPPQTLYFTYNYELLEKYSPFLGSYYKHHKTVNQKTKYISYNYEFLTKQYHTNSTAFLYKPFGVSGYDFMNQHLRYTLQYNSLMKGVYTKYKDQRKMWRVCFSFLTNCLKPFYIIFELSFTSKTIIWLISV